ncbi:PIG-L deacetylase family protein [Ilumatobacter nonamiensis]|uniref:PIG-L deacetylase family protein n=1 Tax=Ilumatobacter nonamiensis TaxID=467093 RepID=UPI000688BA7F|nr:PIG-L deacetylase family protein [Ilumatobacter nonamiensis]
MTDRETETRARGSLSDRWGPTLDAAMPWSPPPRRTIVLAPHPDDESLSSGGLVALQRARGLEVVVVAVTDGEAAYDPDGDDHLASRRRAEQCSALRVLGVDQSAIERLGVPDGRVAESEDAVRDRLEKLLRPGDLLVTTWNRDVHPDHEACGRASVDAVRAIPATLVFSLFWTWHHRLANEIDRRHLLALELDVATQATKRRAIRRHASQFRSPGEDDPILDERIAEPASWSCEYFLAAQPEEWS